MKKYFAIGLLSVITLLSNTTSFGRQKVDSIYPLILHFYSIGTGTPGIASLQQFISTYRRKNKLPVLKATKAGGLGREGEYAILFPLKELNKAQQKKFITALSKAVPTLKQKTDKGGINLVQNESFDESSGRIKPEPVTF